MPFSRTVIYRCHVCCSSDTCSWIWLQIRVKWRCFHLNVMCSGNKNTLLFSGYLLHETLWIVFLIPLLNIYTTLVHIFFVTIGKIKTEQLVTWYEIEKRKLSSCLVHLFWQYFSCSTQGSSIYCSSWKKENSTKESL